MTTSPRLGFTELEQGETVPEQVVAEDFRYVEQGASLFIVKDKDIDDPPGSPADGDAYIVATASPTGAWTGWGKRIAFYVNTAWEDITPIEGTFAYVQDENALYYYDGSSWTPFTAAAGGSAVSTQSGTTYTAVLGDANTYIQFTNASSITFTIPSNASVAFPVGTVIEMEQAGAGALSVAAGAGVTVNSRSSDLTLAGQYAVAFVKKVATNTWTMNGDL